MKDSLEIAAKFTEPMQLIRNPETHWVELKWKNDSFRIRGILDTTADYLYHMNSSPMELSNLDDQLSAQLLSILARAWNHVAYSFSIQHDLQFKLLPQRGFQPILDFQDRNPFSAHLLSDSSLRIQDNQLVFWSPRANYSIMAAEPNGQRELFETILAISRQSHIWEDEADSTRLRLVHYLVSAGLVRVDHPGEDIEHGFDHWEFHDRLMHYGSRIRGQLDFGARFPYLGKEAPLPAIAPGPSSGQEDVYDRPEYEVMLRRDPSLLEAFEARTSTRQYGQKPLRLEKLLELLYRVFRVRGVFGPDKQTIYPASDRPYPSGGAQYELGVYLVVSRCEGLQPGIYYYKAEKHALTRLACEDADRKRLLLDAQTAMGTQVPDVLITLTARFGRLNWKYRGIAYATSLKNVGVIYQSLYLVGTALNIATCGLGSGNSATAERAFGLAPNDESSIGEFAIGSLPESPSPALRSGTIEVLDASWKTAAQESLRGKDSQIDHAKS